MKITFRTKEEANKEQERNFLELSGSQRFYRFIELMQHQKSLPTKAEKINDSSFKIVINTIRE